MTKEKALELYEKFQNAGAYNVSIDYNPPLTETTKWILYFTVNHKNYILRSAVNSSEILARIKRINRAKRELEEMVA